MVEPICEEEGILQEWTPQTRLLQQIPLRTQRGIFSHDLNLTCVDVVQDYIAVGTNSGLVYWYCRENGDLQRLKLQNSDCTVTCVKLVSTVDYMVAAGTDQGTITVFQIPKQPPDSLPESLKPKNKQVERFTIDDLHAVPVTTIEWSQNGMKLFSGDKNGVVVLTEMDFYMHLSKSTELLNEQYEIVQLSYMQQILLISTTFRSIICDGNDRWKVHQVGTKERKVPGRFGATFCKFDHGTVIYASRPGYRVWLADKSGTVQQTLIFKSAVHSTHPKIQIVNPYNKQHSYDTNFGRLIQYGDSKLVAYNSEILYILHPGAISVISCLDCARKILDVSVHKDEIFILEGERSLIRLSHAPDSLSMDLTNPTTSRRTSFILDELAAKLKDTAVGSIKKITSDLIVTPEQISPPALADEAIELPPIVNLPVGSVPNIIPEMHCNFENRASVQYFDRSKTAENINQEPIRKISQVSSDSVLAEDPDFSEDVISRPVRRRNRKRNKILQGHESESDTTSTTSDDRLVWGLANDLSVSEESPSFSQSQSSFSVLRDIPSLLASNTPKSKPGEGLKTPDDKSQASIDTCESVSENLVITPERFLEEQEKTFFRLANQDISLLDSYNSEKTENMSVSFNMTPSSSVSSKISENLPSTSEMSENVSMVSETKTEEGSTSDNSQNDLLPLPKQLCFYRPENSRSECGASNINEKPVLSSTSPSSGNSQNLLNSREGYYESLRGGATGLQCSELPLNVLPDTRSPEVIEQDLKNNEMILSRILGMDLTEMDNGDTTKEEMGEEENKKEEASNVIKCLELDDELLGDGQDELQIEDSGTCLKSNTGTLQLNFPHLDTSSSENAEAAGGDLPTPVVETNHFAASKKYEAMFARYENSTRQNEEEKSLDSGEKRFLSLEGLGYGPPSGSSLTSGSQPSLEYNAVGNSISTLQMQSIEQSDHWIQYRCPELITNLSVCDHYVVCVDVNDRVYYSDLSGLALSWLPLDYKATSVTLSTDGSIVWILNRKTIFALVDPSKKRPFSEEIIEATWNVRAIAVDGDAKIGWIVKPDGQLKCQRDLDRIPVGKTEDVPCDWLVTNVACYKGVTLATTSVEDVICKPSSDSTFRIIKRPSSNITHIALGPGDLAWLVDDANNIYFSDNFLDPNPFWWQMLISDYIFQNSPSPFQNIHNKIRLNNLRASIQLKCTIVAPSEQAVWVFDKFSANVHVNKTDFTGYLWMKVPVPSLPHVKWEKLCAEGVFEDKGHLWLLSCEGMLFCAKPNSNFFKSIPPPCEEVLTIASSADTLWVLSVDGRIYSRLGLTEENTLGNSWRELNLPHIADLRLIWVSCGCDVAWGCDALGRIFITIGSPHDMASNIFDAAWLEVDGKPKEGTVFEKVFVGPHLHMVWAVDNRRNIYVREGIFPHFQIGTGWVYVGGIEALYLTVSGTSVWALSPNGNVYRRFGISENNYIGDYWKRIPGSLRMLTTSFTDGIWGIDNQGNILCLNQKTYILNQKKPKKLNERQQISKENDDWEVVE